MPNFGQYVPEREGFVYNKAENYYQCTKEGGNQTKVVLKERKQTPEVTQNERITILTLDFRFLLF